MKIPKFEITIEPTEIDGVLKLRVQVVMAQHNGSTQLSYIVESMDEAFAEAKSMVNDLFDQYRLDHE